MENEKLLPPGETASVPSAFGNVPMLPPPSRKQQSWGALLSIFVIVLMIIGGAFYSWGKRLAAEREYPALPASE